MILHLVCFLTFLIILYIVVFETLRKIKQWPPGPVVWPIVGNFVEVLLANPRFHYLAFAKMAKRYGDVMGFGFGGHYSIMLSSYEAISYVLVKERKITTDRFVPPSIHVRNKGQKYLGLVWNQGDSWVELRKFVVNMTKHFGCGSAKRMEKLFSEEAHNLAQRMLNDGTYYVRGREFSKIAINTGWQSLAGYSLDFNDKRLEKMSDFAENFNEINGFGSFYSPFPFLAKFFPKWCNYEKHVQMNEEILEFMRERVKDFKNESRNVGTPKTVIQEFFKDIEAKQKNPDRFNEEQLAVILYDMLIGGADVLGLQLFWMVVVLAANPEVQEKVYQEIVANNEELEESPEDSKQLPYTKATILEVQRVSNVTSVNGHRVLTEPLPYGDCIIPKGSVILINHHVHFNDKDYWGDPENFRPERFLVKGEDGKWSVVGEKAVRITTFGLGKRKCLAYPTAWLALTVYITSLIKEVKLSVVPGKEHKLSPVQLTANLTPHACQVKVEKRQGKGGI